MASLMIAGTPAARASATTQARLRGASGRTAGASSAGSVTPPGPSQAESGYWCTPTVCSCSWAMMRGSCRRQRAAIASSGPITGSAPTAGAIAPASCR